MPSVTTSVTAELFKIINGVKVFHTYRNDDMDQGASTYRYTLDPELDTKHFDVRRIDVPATALLNSHPPFKTDSNPVWANADASERAKIDQEWAVWLATGETQVIVEIIDQALQAGILELPPVEESDGEDVIPDGIAPAPPKPADNARANPLEQAIKALQLASECGGDLDRAQYTAAHEGLLKMRGAIQAIDTELNDEFKEPPTGEDYNDVMALLGLHA